MLIWRGNDHERAGWGELPKERQRTNTLLKGCMGKKKEKEKEKKRKEDIIFIFLFLG